MPDILSSYKSGVRIIKFNVPSRKNAMSKTMYQTVAKVLNEDAANDEIVVTIITGAGDYFSSGNDIKSAISDPDDLDTKLSIVKQMIDAFINYPKLLIAVVNGPAIGIAVTFLPLCDIVYASEKAVFDAPFVRLGLCAEGCSSVLFPLILGRSKASEVLYLNHKLTAQEAFDYGLISKIIPHHQLEEFINDLHRYGNISVQSLIKNKRLVMANFTKILSECASREIEQLKDCSVSEDFSKAVMQFLSKRSKL